MNPQFWITAWEEGRTNFHQASYHEKLTEFFPKLVPRAGDNVLVPLCGKSKDMLYLHGLGLNVHGVELYQQAVEDFFGENKLLPVQKAHEDEFEQYTYKNILISCGDLFKLEKDRAFDFVYDRASLVALPPEMRKSYAEVIKRSLKPGGKCLLIAYEYDQSKLSGPPFSVTTEEIHELYSNRFSIKLLESKESTKEGLRLSSLECLKQTVYVLEKLSDVEMEVLK